MSRKRIAVMVATIATLLVMTLCGCTQRILDFTVLSSKNTEMRVPDGAKGPRVEGTDSTPIIIVPLGSPHWKEALDRAIESAGPEYDALIDGVLYYKTFYFIFGVITLKVEGTPIKSQQINVSQGPGNTELLASSKPILYHSRTGKSNDEAIKEIGITHVN